MATKVDTLIDDNILPSGEWIGAPSAYDISNIASVRPVKQLDDSDSPYDVLVTDGVLLVDTQSGAVTLNLPAAADAAGQVLTVKRMGTGVNAVTIDGDGAETIDGSATNTDLDAQYDVLTIVSDGSEWLILNSNIA